MFQLSDFTCQMSVSRIQNADCRIEISGIFFIAGVAIPRSLSLKEHRQHCASASVVFRTIASRPFSTADHTSALLVLQWYQLV